MKERWGIDDKRFKRTKQTGKQKLSIGLTKEAAKGIFLKIPLKSSTLQKITEQIGKFNRWKLHFERNRREEATEGRGREQEEAAERAEAKEEEESKKKLWREQWQKKRKRARRSCGKSRSERRGIEQEEAVERVEVKEEDTEPIASIKINGGKKKTHKETTVRKQGNCFFLRKSIRRGKE